MTDPAPEKSSAYELSQLPIAEITDEQLEVIVADLSRRRALYKAGKGTDDRPDKKKPAGPVSASEKKQMTQDILASIDFKI